MTRHAVRASAVVLAALVAVSGCTSQSVDPSPSQATTHSTTATPPTSPSPSSPTPDATAVAAVQVRKAYLDFQYAVAEAQRTANAHSRKLERFGADAALAQARGFLLDLAHSGIVFRGAPVFDPVVTRVQIDTQRTGWVRDCIDSTNWKPVFKATGKSAQAPGQHARVPAEASVWWNGQRWVVRTLTVDRSQTC